MENHEIELKAIEKLVSDMTISHILSYGEVYNFLREELNNEMIDLIEEYEQAPLRFTLDSETNYEQTGINKAKVGNIEYSWCSPSEKGAWSGYIKTGYYTK